MKRAEQLAQLTGTEIWDLIIIGGGATGLGAAVDAASRGLKTLLLEKNDFAKGTSSRSTKLLHGGVRYLAQGNIQLVKSALKERGLLLKNAPHLTQTLQFIIPAIRWYDKYYYGLGLLLYDWLAGKRALGKTRLLSSGSIRKYLPSLTKKNSRGGVLYSDGQFDDARFAISLALTAVAYKATVLNYAKVIAITKKNNICTGVVMEDLLHQEKYTIPAKVVINATGVFAEDILQLDQPDTKTILSPSQGVHIVINQHFFSGTNALMIPKTKDGRVLFAVPWHGKVILGTTDTPVSQITDEPIALNEEVDFIIDHFNLYNEVPITKKDICSVFTGLRPLLQKKEVRKTASLNRDHSILVSASQLITITGGKWTTYRKMAADVIDQAFRFLKTPMIPSVTETLPLADALEENNLNAPLRHYGKNAKAIIALYENDPRLKEKLHQSYTYTIAEVVWAVEQEMACTVEDVLSRRTRLLIQDTRAAMEVAPKVAKIMATILQKKEDWILEQTNEFLELAKNYLPIESK